MSKSIIQISGNGDLLGGFIDLTPGSRLSEKELLRLNH
jgi:hypothetical protein